MGLARRHGGKRWRAIFLLRKTRGDSFAACFFYHARPLCERRFRCARQPSFSISPLRLCARKIRGGCASCCFAFFAGFPQFTQERCALERLVSQFGCTGGANKENNISTRENVRSVNHCTGANKSLPYLTNKQQHT